MNTFVMAIAMMVAIAVSGMVFELAKNALILLIVTALILTILLITRVRVKR